MKWFRHMTNTRRDPFIEKLIDKFGLEGYARFWMLIEVVASAMDREHPEPEVAMTIESWCRELRCKRKILLLFLEYFQNKMKIKGECSGNVLKITFPNISKIRDEHLSRSGVARDKLQPVDTDTYTDKEPPIPPTEEKGEPSRPNYSPSFLGFWMAYPVKVGKGKAWQSWKRLAPNAPMVEQIMAALEVHKKSSKWGEENGRFIPHPATWLNQRRWEDEAGPGDDKRTNPYAGAMRRGL